MREQKNERITIPERCFKGNCEGCFYARQKSQDNEGRILCKGEPGGYNFSYEKNGCRYYVSKIIQWIKIIGALWLFGAGVELVITIFSH